MAENYSQSAPPPAAADAPSWPLSRIILLALLAVALGLLVFDQVCGQLAQRRAYSRLAKADAEGSVTPDQVHEILGEPSSVEEYGAPVRGKSQRMDVYRFPGIFNRYLVRVWYRTSQKPGVGEEVTVWDFSKGTQGLFGNDEIPSGREPSKGRSDAAPAPAAKAPQPPAASGEPPAPEPKTSKPEEGERKVDEPKAGAPKTGQPKGSADPKSAGSPPAQVPPN